MTVANRKEFSMGLIMSVAFFAVLAFMFTPSFNGHNAFNASDDMFNSISKGSIYYIEGLRQQTRKLEGGRIDVAIRIRDEKYRDDSVRLLTAADLEVVSDGELLRVRGDFRRLLTIMLADSDAMFYNRGTEVAGKYGMDEKKAMYVWYQTALGLEKGLKTQKRFREAALLSEVIKRGLELSYNYYGVEPQKVADRAWIVLFALGFYVVYTLWWGFAIFFVFEGWGLQMSKGAKKEH